MGSQPREGGPHFIVRQRAAVGVGLPDSHLS